MPAVPDNPRPHGHGDYPDSDPRMAPAALIRFYDDDHGPCASYTVTGRETLPVPAGAEEVTVELVEGGAPGSDPGTGRADELVIEAAMLNLTWLAIRPGGTRSTAPGVFLSESAAEAVLARLSPFRGLAGASDAEVLLAADRLINYGLAGAGSGVSTARSILMLAADQARELDNEIPASPWKRQEWLDQRLPESGAFPAVVCLCGSTRFYGEYQKAYYELTMRGEIVLSVGFYPHATEQTGHGEGVGHDSGQKVSLDDLHRRKIDLADYVLVVSDEAGYFGSSTAGEIRYAHAHGKPVAYLHKAALARAVELGLDKTGEDPS